MEVERSGAVRRALDELRQVQLLVIVKKRSEEETAAAGKQKMHGIAQTGSLSIKRLCWARRNRTKTRRGWFQWCSSMSVGESPSRISMVVRCLALRLSVTLGLTRSRTTNGRLRLQTAVSRVSQRPCRSTSRATLVLSTVLHANTVRVLVAPRRCRVWQERAGSELASLRSAASRRLVDQVGLPFARRR